MVVFKTPAELALDMVEIQAALRDLQARANTIAAHLAHMPEPGPAVPAHDARPRAERLASCGTPTEVHALLAAEVERDRRTVYGWQERVLRNFSVLRLDPRYAEGMNSLALARDLAELDGTGKRSKLVALMSKLGAGA